MIDFHSHILPSFDDGPQDVDTSLEMLRVSANSGVKTVVSTSHCYTTDLRAAEQFPSARDAAYTRLMAEIRGADGDFPHILRGAEVYISKNLSKLRILDKLCIENTNYILLEMPYEKWNDDIFEEIYRVTRLGFRPIMAHLDRYLSQESLFCDLLSLNVLCQVNAGAFADKKNRKKILNWFNRDSLHVIGSDMHNLTNRSPNLADAFDIIQSKFGTEYSELLKHNSRLITQNKAVCPAHLPKLGLLKKLTL